MTDTKFEMTNKIYREMFINLAEGIFFLEEVSRP